MSHEREEAPPELPPSPLAGSEASVRSQQARLRRLRLHVRCLAAVLTALVVWVVGAPVVWVWLQFHTSWWRPLATPLGYVLAGSVWLIPIVLVLLIIAIVRLIRASRAERELL